jgi:hypothetical protein
MPKVGDFRSFNRARRSIRDFEAKLWMRKGFGFAGPWTVIEQNRMLGSASDLQRLTKRKMRSDAGQFATGRRACDTPSLPQRYYVDAERILVNSGRSITTGTWCPTNLLTRQGDIHRLWDAADLIGN